LEYVTQGLIHSQDAACEGAIAQAGGSADNLSWLACELEGGIGHTGCREGISYHYGALRSQ
jgi:flavin-binding protein dodecin